METKAKGLALPKELLAGLFVFAASLIYLYFPVLKGLVYDWWHDENYSHGFLLVAFSGYLIWIKREELAQTEIKTSLWGVGVILAGLFLFLLGWVAGEQFTQRVSFLVVLYGGLIFLLGWPLAKKLTFPVWLNILAIPIPYVIYNALTFPLKLFASKIATEALQFFGFSVYRDGNIIILPNMVLEVVDACSGIRSLISLLAVCSILAYFIPKNLYRVILVLSAIPIAIGVNVLRVFVTGILSYKIGPKAAQGFFHTFSGLLVFMLSIFLVFLVHRMVSKRC
ncbi:exosortase/archaeosortase family protein [Thermodesulfatator atlanticus]|uniref:exosortase/archaeosortase family protein n=1 Tax=Thermodesulfatator atlanticus TaxID=501497 RepID=UPI0003B51A32|nr:exosortase/archaeosortase family protein [Thermodesulfatator atlanticus]